jgi:hypothetical protein
MTDHDNGIRTCSTCGDEFDVESEGSEEDGMCFMCEEYFFCASCGVELCKPSECPQGTKFQCSCGVIHRRKDDKMVISGGPEDRPEAHDDDGDDDDGGLQELIEGDQRIGHVLTDIHAERLRQNSKWGRRPGEWKATPFIKLAVLVEELGEVAKSLLEAHPISHLKTELIQVSAVAAAWAEDCDSGTEQLLHDQQADRAQGTDLQGQLEPVTEETPPGSTVVLLDDEGRAHVTRTRSSPWRIGNGTLVVSVMGRTGGYMAQRCHVLSRPGDPR